MEIVATGLSYASSVNLAQEVAIMGLLNIFFLAFRFFMSSKMVALNRLLLERRQKLVDAVDETTANIQNIKLDCTEILFARRIIRRVLNVLSKLIGISVLASYINGVAVVVNQFSILACVGVRISQSREVTLAYWLQILLINGLFKALRISIIDAFANQLQLGVNRRRIFGFITSETISMLPPPSGDAILQISEASIGWNEDPILHEVTLQMKEGQNIIVIGNSK